MQSISAYKVFVEAYLSTEMVYLPISPELGPDTEKRIQRDKPANAKLPWIRIWLLLNLRKNSIAVIAQ